jgi:hypothetical protein
MTTFCIDFHESYLSAILGKKLRAVALESLKRKIARSLESEKSSGMQARMILF